MIFRFLIVLFLATAAACHAPPPKDGSEPGMSAYAKDAIDSTAKIAGLFAVVVALLTFGVQLQRWREDRVKQLEEAKKANAQRAEELRWRKASLSRDALDKLFDDSLAQAAMRMLDWDGREYEFHGKTEQIGHGDVYRALRTTDLAFTAKEGFIRDCFDALFGHFQLMEHFLSINLLEEFDVMYPASYYAEIMARNRRVFEGFLTQYGYVQARRFLNRIPVWKQSADPDDGNRYKR